MLVAAGARAEGECPIMIPQLGHERVDTLPHDRAAFTQGLAYLDGTLYESRGGWGESALTSAPADTNKPLKTKNISPRLFAEGIAILGDEIWMLTWKAGKVLVFDRAGLEPRRELAYAGEGWGLAHDGRRFIMSNGSEALVFRDSESFAEIGRVRVRAGAQPVRHLNELEYIDGAVYANIWRSHRIARIDPASGCVTGWLDLSNIASGEQDAPEHVLNGIAFDPATRLLFITGKRWRKIYRLFLPSLSAQ